MNNIFSMDNVVFRTIGKITDLVWINILTLVFSLPIITMGASFTAMYAVLLKLAKDNEGSLTRTFISAFKDNLRNSTKVWIVVLLVALFYVLDLNLVFQGILREYGIVEIIVIVVAIAMFVAEAMLIIFMFSLMARYDNSVKGTFVNALKLIVAFFPRAVCMVIICLFPIALMCISDYLFFLWVLYGFSFPGYLCCMLMNRIFDKVEEATGMVEESYE